MSGRPVGRQEGKGGKRRKISYIYAIVPRASINDLGGDALRHVASYLPKTSRALLGVALTAPPSSWRQLQERGAPNAASRAVLTSADSQIVVASVVEGLKAEYTNAWRALFPQSCDGPPALEADDQRIRMEQYYACGWEILDFLDIGDLASRLSDDDIFATLMCISGRDVLKKLYLTNCSSVLGSGLEPLRSSAALEQLNLDLFGPLMKWIRQDRHRNHRTGTWAALERMPEGIDYSFRDEAFSVIGDILTTEGSNFRLLHLPLTWLVEPVSCESLQGFLANHKHALIEGARRCYFGFAQTKGDFAKSYCSLEREEDACYECGDDETRYTYCDGCHGIFCASEHDELDFNRCGGCGRGFCFGCERSGKGRISHCQNDNCSSGMCSADCRYNACLGIFSPSEITGRDPPRSDCESCKSMCFDKMRAENEALRAEIVALRIGNDDTKGQQDDEDSSSMCVVS